MDEGTAEFENAINEYEDAGARSMTCPLQVLPGELPKLLLWMATDKSQSTQELKDHVITMAARVLFNKRKSPLHAVALGPVPERGGDDAELTTAIAMA